MEIGIMTQPFSGNYGGILQNWALQQVLRRMGHDPVTVEVVPSHTVSQEWKYLKMNTKALASRVTLQRPGRWFTWEKRRFTEAVAAPLRAFVDTQIRTCRVHASGLGALTAGLGAWIVGSDQVWRPAYNPDLSLPYLAFATDPSVRKIAYAASFGVDTWEYTPAQTAAARQAAARFDAVSVRERSGVGLCREHLGVAAEHVLDPTLLLDREAYLPLCDGDVHPGGTLLVYFLDPTPGKTAWAASLAAARGLKMDAVLPFSLAGMQRREAGDFRLRPVGAWLRAFLEADGKHEEHEAEFFDEMQEQRVCLDTCGSEQDTDEQDPDGSQGNALDGDFPQQQADGDNECQDHDGMPGTGREEKVVHSFNQIL